MKEVKQVLNVVLCRCAINSERVDVKQVLSDLFLMLPDNLSKCDSVSVAVVDNVYYNVTWKDDVACDALEYLVSGDCPYSVVELHFKNEVLNGKSL